MAKSQLRSKRKVTGGKYHKSKKKKLFEVGRNPANTEITEKRRVRVKRTRGGNKKVQLLSYNFVSVSNNKKIEKAKIESVIENPADINFTRRNIITKGAIIKTNLGEVKITSRPGQDGVLNGILVKKN